MAAGKHERGAICVIVAEADGFEVNIGALVTLTQYSHCACGCGAEGWEWEKASRPILISRSRIFPDLLFYATASTDVFSMPGWPPTVIPKHPQSYLLPIKGDGTGEELWQESPLPHEEESLAGLPGFERTWNCRCTIRPITP